VELRTAEWIAAVRARESQRVDRLFDDPYAEKLAGPAGFEAMRRSEAASGGENPVIPVRVRWCDDTVSALVAGGAEQVVLLGAGLDTRPYRLDLPEELHWYEVDRPAGFGAKAGVLAGEKPRCHRYEVAADVTGPWLPALRAAGFDAGRVTAWLAEGLFFYLAGPDIAELLRQAASASPAGSAFVADVMSATGLDSPAMRPYREWCARQGVPPPFGSDDPAGLFAANGWPPERIVAAGGPDANYGRLAPRPDGVLPSGMHFVRAVR
jgi:methyltransferase (TIGR00027 family)